MNPYHSHLKTLFLAKQQTRYDVNLIDKLLTCPNGCQCHSQNIQSTPIRIAPFLWEASYWLASANQSSQADREGLDDIGGLYQNIKIILYTSVHYHEQLVTATGSAIYNYDPQSSVVKFTNTNLTNIGPVLGVRKCRDIPFLALWLGGLS